MLDTPLLQDAPEFAPAALDLHAHLVNAYGQQTTELVFDHYVEHKLLDQPNPAVSVHRPNLALLSTADKAVAFGSLLRRAYVSGNVPGYFAVRPGLRSLLGYFRSYQRAVIGHVLDTLSPGLGHLLDQVDQAVADSPDRR